MKNILMFVIALMLIGILPTPVRAQEKISVDTAKLTGFGDMTYTPDERVYKLKQYLESKGSPMSEAAEQFITEADRLGLDWRLVVAISGNESYFGKHIPYNSYNAWGWAVWTGMSYGANFTNWEDGIRTVSEGLKFNYIDDGLTTVEKIGRRYAADPQWAWKVNHFLADIETFKPSASDQFALAL